MTQFWRRWEQSLWAGRIAVALLLLVVVVTAARTWRQYAPPSREFDRARTGLSDFHNGVYFPSLAFRERVVPYSREAEQRYPMARAAPPYHPIVFLVHQPLTWLELPAADITFFLFSLSLAGALASLAIRENGGRRTVFAWATVTALLLLSRPGHITLFTGYFTLEPVLGVMLAIYWAERRPWLAGLGILLAASKPHHFLPLIFLMLFRRNFRAAAWGLVLCLVTGLACWAWLASASSFGAVFDGFVEGQSALEEDPAEFPVNSWTRVDLLGLVSKWMDWRPSTGTSLVVMAGLLIWPGMWIAQRTRALEPRKRDVDFAANLVIVLSICCSIYNNSYDCLLLFASAIGLIIYNRGAEAFSRKARFGIAAMLGVVGFNYLSTSIGQRLLPLETGSVGWQLLTSVNGICLAAALVTALLTARPTERDGIETEQACPI